MKKVIILLFAIVTTSCTTKGSSDSKETPTSSLKDEHLMDEVSGGLHKIKINDSTTVLIYRGVESCTMIQLK